MATVTSETSARPFRVASRPSEAWWLFLLIGIGWIVVSFLVLAATPTTVLTVAVLTSAVLILAGIDELAARGASGGWGWLRIAFGVLCLVAGVLALVEPLQTFGVLAVIIGWYLLFRGTVSIVVSVMERAVLPLWGLLLASGLAELLLGVWAIGSPARSVWLLVVWLGVGAVLRGVAAIVTAFHIRHRPIPA